MAAPTTAERREGRREELVDAAVRVIRREGAVVSMERIAGEAGITKPILYRHFGDKGGLYIAIADRVMTAIMTDLRESFSANPPGVGLIAAAMDTYLSFVENDSEVYRFLCRHDFSSADRTFKYGFGKALSGLIGAFGFDPEAAEVWGQGMVGMVEAVGDWWIDQPQMPRERVVQHLAELMWEGFGMLGARIVMEAR